MTGEDAVKVKERFIYTPTFTSRKTGKRSRIRMLNADGYIDYAHQKGLISLITEILDQHIEEKEVPLKGEDGKYEKNPDGTLVMHKVQTRWCTIIATAVVKGRDGTVTATGISTVNDNDQFVKAPGGEVMIAETRAKKRALADAACITEELINPTATEPTREAVDTPLEGERDEPDREIPADVRRTMPDIHPHIDGITHGKPSAAAPQFE